MRDIEFLVGGERLRGRLHLPTHHDQKRGPVPGILIIPGFADTAVGPHNMHVASARALTEKGYVVLRFDYRGQGESEGDFRAFTAKAGLADARAALDALSQLAEVDADRLGIVGFSLGGALAWELAAERAKVQVLGLLAPVAYPASVFRAFFSEAHIEQGQRQGWMDWLGWAVGWAFLDELDDFEPLKRVRRAETATLVIHGRADSEVPLANGEAYAACGATLRVLEGGDHQFSSVALQDVTIQALCTWFQKRWLQEGDN